MIHTGSIHVFSHTFIGSTGRRSGPWHETKMSLKEAAKKRRCKIGFEDFEHLNFSTNATIFPYKLYYNLLTMQRAYKRSSGSPLSEQYFKS